MIKYILKRLLVLLPVLLVISIVIFGTIKAMPGDEVTAYFGAGSRATEEQREQVRERLGLDKSLPEQYVRWLGRVVTGDLGNSVSLKKTGSGCHWSLCVEHLLSKRTLVDYRITVRNSYRHTTGR